jgi:fumarate reductase subunit C
MADMERHISQEAYELAGIYQLGTPEAEYYVSDILSTPEALSCLFSLLIWFTVILFISFANYQILNSPQHVFMVFIRELPLVIGFGVISLLVARMIIIHTRTQYFRLYSYTEGLVRRRIGDNRIDALRWEQIETVWRRISTGYDRDQEQLIKDCFYIIELVNGTQWRIRGGADLQEIGHMSEGIILEKKLSETIAAYDTGNTITFGKFSLNLQQVSNGKETLTWDEIARIEVTEYGIDVIL